VVEEVGCFHALRCLEVEGREGREAEASLQVAVTCRPYLYGQGVSNCLKSQVHLLQGEGRVAMATADLMLGEWLPDADLVFKVGQWPSKWAVAALHCTS